MSKHSIRWLNNRPNTYRTVLYLGKPSSPLANFLYDVLADKGALSMSLHADSKLICESTAYDCYVLDADFLGEVGIVMRRIFKVQPTARVLVVSNAYDWRDTVQAFEYGAIDVIRQPKSSMAVYHTLQVVLKQTLPERHFHNASVN